MFSISPQNPSGKTYALSISILGSNQVNACRSTQFILGEYIPVSMKNEIVNEHNKKKRGILCY